MPDHLPTVIINPENKKKTGKSQGKPNIHGTLKLPISTMPLLMLNQLIYQKVLDMPNEKS